MARFDIFAKFLIMTPTKLTIFFLLLLFQVQKIDQSTLQLRVTSHPGAYQLNGTRFKMKKH